jgi:hypothetical protein
MAKKAKANKVKARSKAGRQVKKTSPALSFDSPADFFVFHAKNRRLTEITLIAGSETKLRPLKCQSWSLEQNPDFAYLTVVLKPNTKVTATRWRDCFGILGHSHDYVAQLSKTASIRVPRPVCLEANSSRLVFGFVLPPKPRVSIE